MNKLDRVTNVYNKSDIIPFDDTSKFVLMSDCHRGDGSRSDNFLSNRNIYYSALSQYYYHNFTYIELGDGDELWENRRLSDIIQIHKEVFGLLSKFHDDQRLYLMYGNHDMEKRNYKYVNRNIQRYYAQREQEDPNIFNNVKVHEGLVLRHSESDDKILLIHGHQMDTMSSSFWRLSKFLVRYVWKPLENFGVNDPTSAAKNYKKKISIAKKLTKWVAREKHILIAGHNHRPSFPDVGQVPYFNDGSCIHPNAITAIEISNGTICLVKWSEKVKNDGSLYIARDILGGPNNLQEYFAWLHKH
ncbi:metallophosphoesterase [Ruminiclostridium cellobioparum]|uniref:Calcineurin-like phosphoesterase domain-containing protein n=1 Tax=Ruminiclostridium cellobioparum subsp. termitidis CT1112 TaxID=1195236 RepID=S0FJX1_RUMCE|nr:metallophosphoesterase [Ruminiclostridium cellobioparum]EMS72102.1 hypothetical protein CTER_2109 [Ruminiclostridium cellobioparum subsp. termitidis CT1112]